MWIIDDHCRPCLLIVSFLFKFECQKLRLEVSAKRCHCYVIVSIKKSLPPIFLEACRAGAIHWIHHCLGTETIITITGRDSSPRYWMYFGYFGRITFVIQGYPTPLREDQSLSENPRRSRFAGHSFWPSSIPQVKWHNFMFQIPV